MKCDIIIPVWNQLGPTKRCIESIQKNTKCPYRLILIDNNSDGETRDYLRNLAEQDRSAVLIRNEENLGFIKATNRGLGISDKPYVCLMNNDAEVTWGWLTEMISVAESDPAIGLVNPRSKGPDKTYPRSYLKGSTRQSSRYLETNQCMGYCMLIKRVVLEKIGYLDEAYGLGGFDDTDFSKRAHIVGYKCVCAKDAYVFHKWHTSFNAAGDREALVKRNEAIFFSKWGRYLRIGYPISPSREKDLCTDINTSLGLAREWNWVHAWVSANSELKKSVYFSDLPEHQSLRLFNMSGIKAIFYIEVLFKLIERRLKGKKLFDVILVSDKGLLRVLSLFKEIFSFPLIYIGGDEFQAKAASEETWRRRAKEIVGLINKRRNR
ncbi:glycosyltransferase family 2 protein [Omnitrophica bacterium]|nr:glycosyltransferase family 2 protein [Candidatus Omnitrophota bacterium]